ncbi:non-specific serine/threonine protein kinase [Toxoplasma gondii GT1]|uniref:Non-specific serine/threonine protein kinase n=1 Tax=Toxoplasma gondii (strain ATCC 50853 / GT1) TaxID=507601 RepID=S7W373_TOXGG|nr:non-specific serine/threonine protein kinase [Toxoplasma gondii GT1]
MISTSRRRAFKRCNSLLQKAERTRERREGKGAWKTTDVLRVLRPRLFKDLVPGTMISTSRRRAFKRCNSLLQKAEKTRERREGKGEWKTTEILRVLRPRLFKDLVSGTTISTSRRRAFKRCNSLLQKAERTRERREGKGAWKTTDVLRVLRPRLFKDLVSGTMISTSRRRAFKRFNSLLQKAEKTRERREGKGEWKTTDVLRVLSRGCSRT